MSFMSSPFFSQAKLGIRPSVSETVVAFSSVNQFWGSPAVELSVMIDSGLVGRKVGSHEERRCSILGPPRVVYRRVYFSIRRKKSGSLAELRSTREEERLTLRTSTGSAFDLI